DNSAARLLSRPGEAIYNDAGGMVEGNSPFQIAWLPDEKREEYLKRIEARARQTGYRPPERQAVFEGNISADNARKQPLGDLLAKRADKARGPWSLGLEKQGVSVAPVAIRLWLGDAIAIKDPTAAVIRRQTGSNLAIIGQREESATAMLGATMVSIAAQLSV